MHADARRGLIVSDIQSTLVFANTLATDILRCVRIGAGIDDYSCMHGLFKEEGRPGARAWQRCLGWWRSERHYLNKPYGYNRARLGFLRKQRAPRGHSVDP